MKKIFTSKQKALFLISIIALLASFPAITYVNDNSDVKSYIAHWSFFGYQLLLDPQKSSCLDDKHFFILEKFEEKELIEKGINPIKGQLWAFSAPYTGFYKTGQLMVKVVVGVPGDHLLINSNGIFINGSLLSNSFKAAENLGINPQIFYRQKILKADEYFMMGTSEASFDSRYFGTIKINSFKGHAYALF